MLGELKCASEMKAQSAVHQFVWQPDQLVEYNSNFIVGNVEKFKLLILRLVCEIIETILHRLALLIMSDIIMIL